ncbi:GIY-YIG nuclease family protein [Clostridium sp. AF29-8BH]|uniref:GIY-YIG nuclease family protein n=1 Tax=Clostridium sp. AF29-8BH TaxID=2293009 RepID=UPI000E51BAB4|nr:GIY-YIG nuclease family protein [Clostridium sp. AF29-8BH]
MDYKKLRQTKAIERKNKQLFLKLNKKLNDSSGIYILFRTDENDIKYFYCGQAKHILSRLAQHMSGYQHIDLSLKKRGLWSENNPYGWIVFFKNYQEKELDEKEQFWILEMTKRGYQCRYNKTAGGQGSGKEKINEFRPAKGYRDGIQQGRKAMARELSSIVEKHLTITLRAEKQGNKISERQFEKFKELLNEGTLE